MNEPAKERYPAWYSKPSFIHMSYSIRTRQGREGGRGYCGIQSSPSFRKHTAAVAPRLSQARLSYLVFLYQSLRSHVPSSGAFLRFHRQLFFLSFSSIWPFLKIWLPSSTYNLYEISPTREAQFLDTAVVYVSHTHLRFVSEQTGIIYSSITSYLEYNSITDW